MNQRPRKSLGQNFLVDPSIALRIVQALDSNKTTPIVEIGPGRGILTDYLLQLGRPVTAIEKDRELALRLKEKYRTSTQIHVITGDILEQDLSVLLRERNCEKLSFIGNIPFNITSPLLGLFLSNRAVVDDLVLMIQREFAERLVASPGGDSYGGLTVIFNYFSTMEIVLRVRSGSFFPIPAVDATVLRVRFGMGGGHVRAEDEAHFMRIVRALFGWRRKQVRTTLKKHPDFEIDDRGLERLADAVAFPLSNRPEELSLEEFILLSNQLVKLE